MLLVANTALNASSFMGIILMVGLVVKNGIILFEYVHKLWEEQGIPLGEALVEAGKIRVCPLCVSWRRGRCAIADRRWRGVTGTLHPAHSQYF